MPRLKLRGKNDPEKGGVLEDDDTIYMNASSSQTSSHH